MAEPKSSFPPGELAGGEAEPSELRALLARCRYGRGTEKTLERFVCGKRLLWQKPLPRYPVALAIRAPRGLRQDGIGALPLMTLRRHRPPTGPAKSLPDDKLRRTTR